MNGTTRTALLLLGFAYVAALLQPVAGQEVGFSPADLLTRTDVSDVRLSPDGQELLFVTRRAIPAEDRFEQKIWRMRAEPSAKPRVLAEGEGERTPRWAPDGRRITWISNRRGSPQVWVLDSGEEEARQVTSHPAGVQSYAWSPSGRRLAFTALAEIPDLEAAAGKDRKEGVVIDKSTFVIYRLFGNAIFQDERRRTELFLVGADGGKVEPVNGSYSVGEYAWSPEGRALAFIGRLEVGGWSTPRADLLLYSLEGRALRTLKEGRTGQEGVYDWDDGVTYSQPFWSPDGARIGFTRTDQSDRWSARDEVGIHSLTTGETRFISVDPNHDFYTPEFHWLTENDIVVEDRWRGRGGLLSLSVADGALSPLVLSDRYADNFSFSASGERAAWVQEALDQPPEIFIADRPFSKRRKLTVLNARLASVRLPRAEPVQWRSTDGVEVEGWLVRPLDYENGKRYPLLVLVHGGPGVALANEFLAYHAWPYPVQSFAARGYAVLLPNYRGTGSYSKAFREPTANEKEPVEDIVAGIRYLVDQGVADSAKIGIMGQSHGSWLGPMTIVRHPIFKAASFAEGSVDIISRYGHMPGWLNLNVHEHYQGNPYENLDHYLEISPIFRLKDAPTPTLLEYGQESLAVQGMEYATALWRHGIPHEFVVYPGTGHNISSAALLLESAERNLDWFDFWMTGKMDPAPEKQEQYNRWKKMQESYSVYEPVR